MEFNGDPPMNHQEWLAVWWHLADEAYFAHVPWCHSIRPEDL